MLRDVNIHVRIRCPSPFINLPKFIQPINLQTCQQISSVTAMAHIFPPPLLELAVKSRVHRVVGNESLRVLSSKSGSPRCHPLQTISSLVTKETVPLEAFRNSLLRSTFSTGPTGSTSPQQGTFGLSWNAEMGFHDFPVFVRSPRKLCRIVAPQIACHVLIQETNLPAVVLRAPKDVGVRANQILLAAYLLLENFLW